MLLNDLYESAPADQVKGTEKAKMVKPRPHSGSQPHPFQGRLVGGESKEDSRPEDNFSPDDIKKLERTQDINAARKMAIELISMSSKRSMKPAKVEWFKRAVYSKKNVLDIVKLMYDLLLSGEGNKVIGSRHSTDPNSYRKAFGEDANPTDKITMDIPLFIRMLEYAKEDAKSDMDLHDLTERAIQLMKEHDYLCMDNYDTLVGGQTTGGEQAIEGRFDEPLSGWRIVDKKHGQARPEKFASKDDAQKYLMSKLFANHQDYEIKSFNENVKEAEIEVGVGYAIKLPSGKLAKASNGKTWWHSSPEGANKANAASFGGEGSVVKVKLKNDQYAYNGHAVEEGKKKITAKNDPCWSGYHMVGTKNKNGKEVPNCVPGKKG